MQVGMGYVNLYRINSTMPHIANIIHVYPKLIQMSFILHGLTSELRGSSFQSYSTTQPVTTSPWPGRGSGWSPNEGAAPRHTRACRTAPPSRLVWKVHKILSLWRRRIAPSWSYDTQARCPIGDATSGRSHTLNSIWPAWDGSRPASTSPSSEVTLQSALNQTSGGQRSWPPSEIGSSWQRRQIGDPLQLQTAPCMCKALPSLSWFEVFRLVGCQWRSLEHRLGYPWPPWAQGSAAWWGNWHSWGCPVGERDGTTRAGWRGCGLGSQTTRWSWQGGRRYAGTHSRCLCRGGRGLATWREGCRAEGPRTLAAVFKYGRVHAFVCTCIWKVHNEVRDSEMEKHSSYHEYTKEHHKP